MESKEGFLGVDYGDWHALYPLVRDINDNFLSYVVFVEEVFDGPDGVDDGAISLGAKVNLAMKIGYVPQGGVSVAKSFSPGADGYMKSPMIIMQAVCLSGSVSPQMQNTINKYFDLVAEDWQK